MKEEKLLDALGQVDEAYIEESNPNKKRKKNRNRTAWIRTGALVCASVFLVVIALSGPFRDKSGTDNVAELTEGISEGKLEIADSGAGEEGQEDVIAGGAQTEAAPDIEADETTISQGYFNGTVLEISEDSIVVSCIKSQFGDLKEGTEVLVSLRTVSSEPIPELRVGDKVRVLYIGDVIVTEDYAATEKTVSIFLIGEDGEIIVEE